MSNEVLDQNTVQKNVQEYYGKTLQGSEDLKTNACCTVVNYPTRIKKALSKIHDEVLAKYYGCGLTIPTNIKNCRVLDLGSGSGRDCYLTAQLTGPEGSVVGIDMTDEQLDVANRHIEYHKEKFGYAKSNVEFKKGNIEKLNQVGLKSDDFDIIISNCVVNLASDKRAVLSEAFRVLKEGGEFYFSDVYASRRIPKHLVDDKELYGECLSGALYYPDFEIMARQVGFLDPRVVSVEPITIENDSVLEKTQGYEFNSVTYRLFKSSRLEWSEEDYGQAVRYKGTVIEEPNHFVLDQDHQFIAGKIYPVSGNTSAMLSESRFADHFDFFGDRNNHFGPFDVQNHDHDVFGENIEVSTEEKSSGGGCC